MTKKSVTSARLQHVYTHTTVEEKRKIYQDWAQTYDQETQVNLGYIGPMEAAKVFAGRLPDRGVRVLDAGCGTGQVGVALYELGYRDIHGADFSPEMLTVAEHHNVYTTLSEIDLSRSLTIDGLYDAAISVGLYGFGPPLVEHVHHVVNAVKPNGLIIFTVNGKGWEDRKWAETLPVEMEKHQLVMVDLFDIDYITKENIRGKLVILKRPGGINP